MRSYEEIRWPIADLVNFKELHIIGLFLVLTLQHLFFKVVHPNG